MGAPTVGGHPQPPVRGPGLAPASALGPPLPADAVFPAPARDTPAARRPPGVWHSRASAVSRQQPPAGAQRSSGWHPWGCGPGAQSDADNRPQTCAGQWGVHTRVRVHEGLHAACRMHARTRHGKAACRAGGDEEQRVGVQGAGCARGWVCSRAAAVGVRRPQGCDGRPVGAAALTTVGVARRTLCCGGRAGGAGGHPVQPAGTHWPRVGGGLAAPPGVPSGQGGPPPFPALSHQHRSQCRGWCRSGSPRGALSFRTEGKYLPQTGG